MQEKWMKQKQRCRRCDDDNDETVTIYRRTMIRFEMHHLISISIFMSVWMEMRCRSDALSYSLFTLVNYDFARNQFVHACMHVCLNWRSINKVNDSLTWFFCLPVGKVYISSRRSWINWPRCVWQLHCSQCMVCTIYRAVLLEISTKSTHDVHLMKNRSSFTRIFHWDFVRRAWSTPAISLMRMAWTYTCTSPISYVHRVCSPKLTQYTHTQKLHTTPTLRAVLTICVWCRYHSTS